MSDVHLVPHDEAWALKVGGDERVRLLHLLTRTPAGVAFRRAPRKQSAQRRAARRSGSTPPARAPSPTKRVTHGSRVRTHA